VELASGPAVFAMCAVDALGIPQMLRRDGRISSVDPASGPVADCCCPFINFHINPEAAEVYRRAHPDMTGQLFGQTEAAQVAKQAFGGLLDPSNPQERTP
jgi:alkylmercury lyase